jgi:hypothetical protein
LPEYVWSAQSILFSKAEKINDFDHNKKFVMPSEYEGNNYKAKISEKRYETDMDYPYAKEDTTEYFDLYTYSLELK